MSLNPSSAAAPLLRRLIADGIESGDGRRLTGDLVEELRDRALGTGERSA
ncbi:MAG: hypothetical protein ABIP36_01360 [Acidimicrobiales bacterium]